MWYFGTPPHADPPIHSTAASRAAVEGRSIHHGAHPPLMGIGDPYAHPGYEDYEPLLNSSSPTTSDRDDAAARGRPAGTSTQAFMNTYRAIVGTGILALPGAIEAAGIGYGVLLLVTAGVVSLLTMQLLLQCIRELRNRARLGEVEREWEYTDLGRVTLGPRGAATVLVAAVLCQVGNCVAYLVFVAHSVVDILPHWCTELEVLLGVLPVLMLLSWMPSTNYLAPTSTMGNVAFLVVCVAIFWYGFTETPPRALNEYTWFDHKGIPVFLGVCIFVMTAHCEIISIEQGLTASARKEYPHVLNLTFATVLFTYLTFGIVCYLFFGENTNDIILVNLNSQNPVVLIIKAMMTVSLLFQYPVTLFPALAIIDEQLGLVPSPGTLAPEFGRECGRFRWLYAHLWYVCHAAVVSLTVALAYLTPSFELYMGFIGAFTNGLVAYTMPLVFYIALLGEDMKKMKYYGLVFLAVASTVVWMLCSFDIFVQMIT